VKEIVEKLVVILNHVIECSIAVPKCQIAAMRLTEIVATRQNSRATLVYLE
jgi:hypothetical protein